MDFLFDIGNVIIKVDFIPSLRRLIPENTEDIDRKLTTILTQKDEFEAGRISPEEYFPWAAETIGFSGSQQEFLEAWIDIFTPNHVMWQTIETLYAEGHRLILFSNINNPHKEHLLQTYPIFNRFVGGVFSYDTGHIKPEAEIYQLAIDTWQLTPENTAYIDDLAANIAAGKKAGFQCHQYDTNDHKQFLHWLNELE